MMHLPREPWFAGVTAGVLTLVVLGIDARPRRGRQSSDELAAPIETRVLVGPDGSSVTVAQRPWSQGSAPTPAPAAPPRGSARPPQLSPGSRGITGPIPRQVLERPARQAR